MSIFNASSYTKRKYRRQAKRRAGLLKRLTLENELFYGEKRKPWWKELLS